MNKFTTIAAMCLFGLMASAVQASEMATDTEMMDDDKKPSMDNHHDMKKDDMSDSMDQSMKSDDMSEDDMEMKDTGMGMKDDMKSDGMDKSDSMN